LVLMADGDTVGQSCYTNFLTGPKHPTGGSGYRFNGHCVVKHVSHLVGPGKIACFR